MQISFDPTNPLELEFIKKLFEPSSLSGSLAEVDVANNVSTFTVSTASSDDGVSVGDAASVSSLTEAAPNSAEKPKRGRKPKEDKAAPVEEPAAVGEAKPVSIDDVRAALQSYTVKNGMEAGINLLAEYQASRVGELNEAHFAEFVEKCAA